LRFVVDQRTEWSQNLILLQVHCAYTSYFDKDYFVCEQDNDMADLNQTNPEDSGQSNVESSEQVGQAPLENFLGEEDVQVKFCVKRWSSSSVIQNPSFFRLFFVTRLSFESFHSKKIS
jgi:hypothetical protein